MREFLDGLTERHVGITRQLLGAITQLQAEIADQRGQIQANTQALHRVLDRLEPGGS
jgi:ABC-type transporter Mla subunit MlaD